MKCDLCKEEVEEHFLHKLKGTYVKVDGKLKTVCKECQKKHGKELKSKL